MTEIPGKIRPSQLISTFGPGAIVDLPDDSVMIIGIDEWPYGDVILEPRLQKILGVMEFYAPKNEGKFDVPCISFPTYRVCVKCHRLSNRFPVTGQNRLPRCNCGGKTHPARLIVACDRGHIEDFPWILWAHQDGKVCSQPELYLNGTWTTGSLKGLVVKCKTCGLEHDLGGATGASHVFSRCNGRRPWLGRDCDESDCDSKPRGLLRGASNVYFPVVVSAVSIPPWTDPRMQRLEKKWSDIENWLEEGVTLDQIARVYFKGMSIEEVEQIIGMRKNASISTDLKWDEWLKLSTCNNENDENFTASPGEVPVRYSDFIEKIVLISRLREVRVLRGFTRIEPPGEDSEASFAWLSRERTDWLPAVETRGEGIFIILDKQRIERWENIDKVQERVKVLNKNYNRWLRERQKNDYKWVEITPRFVFLHTLAHLLIRQLSLECGYSSSSLRERIYADNEMRGILIYTATPDSDGSLGGLVMQGEPERFAGIMDGLLEDVVVCSSDPLCAEHDPAATGSFNAAACHACTLISETSCEKSNRLLDRALVMDLPMVTGYGFFSME
ncbi:DUF1998 domain-containing protein [Desulfofundulus salinus]|uniref:DUF1998 domain-containing protein n=1 Tax=Desulfofundulus salinus TaxID=2419843 RepID=A0A494X4V0_9FIRM|nr:DUF1998 domain-containing protein [Desulfofundulus salinum]RKO67804.1 DUF1998 domain-containing protein [Desulfofundulus salinum]